ncbi:membrane protein [Betaproteobacteria bacterium]|nr:membrane protein [Betaproteobacteria bacterium]GHU42696.1 membrane protein [Betaproteobacteria bacterium]
MQAIFRMKKTAALLLLCVYVTFVFLNLHISLPVLSESIKNHTRSKQSISEFPKAFEHVANETIYEKQSIINLYSLIQVILDKNEENNFEVVKDTDGNGQITWFQENTWIDPVIFERLDKFKANLPQNTRLIAIVFPDKQIRNYTRFSTGLPNNYVNERADFFISRMQDMNIDVLDTRENLMSSGLDTSNLFFQGDHHWRLETAFFAFTEIAKFMNTSYNLPLDQFYMDRANYNSVKYSKVFTGSLFRKTGFPFLDADDFELMYPKFSTNYKFSEKNSHSLEDLYSRQDRFERVFFIPDSERKQVEIHLGYNAMSSGMDYVRRIQNMNRKNGQTLLVIQDSFGNAATPFLAALFSDIWIIDPRTYIGNGYSDLIKTAQPDYVIITLCASLWSSTDFFPIAMER